MTFDPTKFKARCSSIHTVMAMGKGSELLTEKQKAKLEELENKIFLTESMKEELARLQLKKDNGNKIVISDGCVTYLTEWYAWETQKMVKMSKEVMETPQMQKGIYVETDSLDLLCSVDRVVYKENRDADGGRQRVENEYLSGEVDCYVGNSIMEAEIVPDIKSIWDYPTFLGKTLDDLSHPNNWQLKGYGDITGAKKMFVANCLVNTPAHIVYDMRQRLLRKLNCISDESPEFIEKWEVLEHSMTFDTIPARQRVYKKDVEPLTPEQKQYLYDRVKACRDWLFDFHEQYEKLNS